MASNKEQNADPCSSELLAVSFGTPEVVFWIIVSLATVAGNGISIWKLLKSKRRWLNHNIYLVSLLSTDLIVGAALHPLVALGTYRGYGSCQSSRAVRGFAYFNMSISLWSSLAIAVNRYKALSIKKARACNRMQTAAARRKKTPFLVVFAIWLFTTSITVIMFSTNSQFKRLQLMVPLLLITIVVLYIVVSLKLRAIYRKTNPAILKRNGEYRKHSSSLRLIQLIILNMLMTCLPVIILRAIQASVKVNILVLAIANKVYLLSSMFDPLCYVLVKFSSV